MTETPTEFNVTTLRVERTDETSFETEDDLLGVGAELPSGLIILDWNLEAFAEDNRLDHPHQSIYGSRDDVELATGGRVVTDDDVEIPTPDPDPEPEPDPDPDPDDEDPAPEAPDEFVLKVGSNASTPAMSYQFTVEGEVAEEASLEDHDEISEEDGTTTVTGRVGPKGSDVYRLENRPTSWTALDENRRFVAERRYDLVLDGEAVTLDDLLEGGRETRRVEVVAPGELEYSLEATGGISPVYDDESDWSAERGNDTVAETDAGHWRLDGYTGNGYGDAYEVTGDLLEFRPSRGAFAVYVDGVQVDPASIGADAGLEEVTTQVGGGRGYEFTVAPDDADVEVSTLKGLGNALDDATEGDVVYLAGNAHIEMGSAEVTVPEGVTLASNRGIAGAPGGHLETDEETEQIHAEADSRVTGLRVQGKYYEYFDPRGGDHYPVGNAVQVEGEGVEIDNCELWGHAHASVDCRLDGGTTHIHHNHIHHTPRAGLGYGVVTWSGHPVIEWNYFNYNRHAVAGSGGRRCGYTARYNHVGPETIGHIFDMHKPGGDRIEIYRNTVEGYQMLQSAGGQKYTAAVMVRGTPSEHCHVYDNWFYNDKPPRDQPSSYFTSEAIVQVHVTEWDRVEWWNNHLGREAPDDPEVGAPELWGGR